MRIVRFCDAISEHMPHVIFLIYHTSKCEYIPHILKHAVTWWQWDGSLQGSYEFDLLFRPQVLAVVSIYGTVFVNITYVANNIFPCNLRDGFIYQCSLVNHNENCVLSSVFSLRMSGLQNQTWHLDILYLKGFRIYSVCWCANTFDDTFFPEASIGLRVLSLPASVRPSVHKFVCAITHHPFKLGSPHLDHRCKRPWLRSLLFWEVIDLDRQGQI